MKFSYPVTCPDASAKVIAWCEDYEEVFPYLKNVGYDGIELLVKNPDVVDKKLLETLLENMYLTFVNYFLYRSSALTWP